MNLLLINASETPARALGCRDVSSSNMAIIYLRVLFKYEIDFKMAVQGRQGCGGFKGLGGLSLMEF